MSRIAPALPENLSTARKAVAWEKEIEVQLITRLFGGGARPREIDERSWLRPAALKGALRFWWRATHAHLAEYDSLQKLKEREDLLFGSAARFGKKDEIKGGPGWLSVEVLNAVPANLGKEEFVPEEGSALNIAYFGAAGQGRDAATLGIPGKGDRAKLRLLLTEASAEKEILVALRAFFVLGGIGARSRRGAGALAVFKQADATDLGVPTTRTAVAEYLRHWVQVETPERPSLRDPRLFALANAEWASLGRRDAGSAEEAQKRSLELLRLVRQRRPHPSHWGGRNQWGQTEWPEADAVRLAVGTSSHPTVATRAGNFPRGVLGLPIVFHFKDEGPTGDPGDHTLYAQLLRAVKRLDRYTSPLLLRPVVVWGAKGREFLSLALWTRPTLPEDALPVLEPGAAKKGGATLSKTQTFPLSIASAAENAQLIQALDEAFNKATDFERIR